MDKHLTRFSLPPWPWLLIAGFGAYELLYLAEYWIKALSSPDLPFGDFRGFWSFAKFIHSHAAADIYDPFTIGSFQHALMQQADGYYPCLYPPIFLLYLWPLGSLGFYTAAALWIGTTLAAYLWTCGRGLTFWLAATAPTTLLGIISGQNGFLSAAFAIGGFRLLVHRPLLAGALLGGLCFKPQFLPLVIVALVAARRWRALAALGITVIGLIATSAAAFGFDTWWHWLHSLPDLLVITDATPQLWDRLRPTIYASLMATGFPHGFAATIQFVASIGLALVIWMLLRRDRTEAQPMHVAALQIAMVLATPHALVYDMPLVTNAAGVVLISRAHRPSGAVPALLAALLLPITCFSNQLASWPWGAPLILILLLATLIWRPARGVAIANLPA